MFIEELNKLKEETFNYLNELLYKHRIGECKDNECGFCYNEVVIDNKPLEILWDKLGEEHYKRHGRDIGYPFYDLCEYCREEYYNRLMRFVRGSYNIDVRN